MLDLVLILSSSCVPSSLVTHMESETFMGSEEICVCVLKNIRGMLSKPPELNEAVSIASTTRSLYGYVHVLAGFC